MGPARPFPAWEAAAWAHRVPRSLLTVLSPLALVVLTVVDLAAAGTGGVLTAEDASSFAHALGYVGIGLTLAALVVLPVAPRPGTWVAAAGGALLAVTEATVLVGAWYGAAVAFALLGLLDAALTTRQHAFAAAWNPGAHAVPGVALPGPPGPVVVPPAAAPVRRWLLSRRLGVVAAGFAGLALGVVAGASYVHDAAAATAFREVARTATTTVQEVDEEGFAASVRIDGVTYRVPYFDPTPVAGEAVTVRYDPVTGRAELTSEAFDAAGSLVLATAGAVTGSSLLAAERRRRHRLDELLATGGVPLGVLATTTAPGFVSLAPVDAPGRPFAVLRSAAGFDEDAITFGEDGAGPEPGSRSSDDPSEPDLRRWMAVSAARHWPDEDAFASVGPAWAAWRAQPVDVVGLDADDVPVAVRGPGGEWVVARAGLRDPRTLRGLVSTQAGERPATGPGSAWEAFWASVDEGVQRFARLTGTTLPWVVALGAGALTHWLWLDPEYRDGVVGALSVLVAAGVGHAWAAPAFPRLRLGARSIAVRRSIVSRVTAWSDVIAVVGEGDALRLRIGPAPGTTLSVISRHAARTVPLLPGDPPVAEVRERIERARREALPGPSVRWSRRPTPAAVCGLWWLACAAAGLALAA